MQNYGLDEKHMGLTLKTDDMCSTRSSIFLLDSCLETSVLKVWRRTMKSDLVAKKQDILPQNFSSSYYFNTNVIIAFLKIILNHNSVAQKIKKYSSVNLVIC